MKEQYHVQAMANQRLKAILPSPDGFEVSEEFLHNIDNETFLKALKQLQESFKGIMEVKGGI